METRSVKNANAPSLGAASVSTPTGGAVESTGVEKSSKAKKAGDAGSSASAKQAKQDWNLDISPKAKEMSDAFKKASDIARATPDIREDRVAAIKQKLADGTYEINSGKIADGIMREAILDHLAENER